MSTPHHISTASPAQRRILVAAALLVSSVSLIAALTGCHSTPPPTPLADLNPQQARGHGVFQAHCSQCHYDRVTEPLHGPPLRGIFKKPYLPSGAPANDDRVTATILHGRNMMPAQSNLDPDDLTDLLTYLHTL